jgi:hypothetical protein
LGEHHSLDIAIRDADSYCRESGGTMAAAMGFFSKFSPHERAEERLLAELAELAGRSQGVVERLERHGAQCGFVNIRAGVLEIAKREAVQVKALNAILAAHNVWSKLPEAPLHEGSNNWERLSNDLEELRAICGALRGAIAKWEPIDQAVSEKLLAIAMEDSELESRLRQHALKCDPQALD